MRVGRAKGADLPLFLEQRKGKRQGDIKMRQTDPTQRGCGACQRLLTRRIVLFLFFLWDREENKFNKKEERAGGRGVPFSNGAQGRREKKGKT